MNRLGKVPALDGVRAIAILLVIAVHAGWISGGRLGVDLFFVLSGFLITALLIGEWHRTDGIEVRAFYVRRALRLVPALALLLLAYLGYGLVSGRVGSPQHVLVVAAIGGTYVENFFTAASSGQTAQYLWHLWSLAEEEQFYLVWPLVLLFALRRRTSPKALLALIGGLIVAVTLERALLLATGASQNRIWFGPDTHSDALMVGCAAAVAWTHRLVRIGARTALVGLGVAAGVIFVMGRYGAAEQGTYLTYLSPIFPIACVVVIVYLVGAPQSLGARLLGLRPIRYIGAISYGLYLWHLPLMHLAGVRAGLMLTAAIAAISYRYLEAPIRRAGAARWGGRPAAPPATLAFPLQAAPLALAEQAE